MATSTCATPIKGTVLRIVELDTCGVPVTGTSGLVATSSGFVQVVMSPQYEDGTEFFDRNAAGDACVNQKDKPIFKRHELTIDWCEVNVLLAAYVIDAQVLGTGAPVTGTGFAQGEGDGDNRFSLEVWQEVAGAGACDASGSQRFIYHAWPNVGNTKLGDYTIENDKSELEFVSETASPGVGWLDLVGSDWLPVGTVLESGRHWLWNVTTTPPPDAACDTTTL